MCFTTCTASRYLPPPTGPGFIPSFNYLSRVKVPEHGGICDPPGGGHPQCSDLPNGVQPRAGPHTIRFHFLLYQDSDGGDPMPQWILESPAWKPQNSGLFGIRVTCLCQEPDICRENAGRSVRGRKIRASAKPERYRSSA